MCCLRGQDRLGALLQACPRPPRACCFFVEPESSDAVLASLEASLPPRCVVVGTSAGGGLCNGAVAGPHGQGDDGDAFHECVTLQLMAERRGMSVSPFHIKPASLPAKGAPKGKGEGWTARELDALFFPGAAPGPGPADHVALAFFVAGAVVGKFHALARAVADVYGARASVAGGLALADVYYGPARSIQRIRKGIVGLAMTGPRVRATTSLYSRQRAQTMAGVARRLLGAQVRFGFLFSCVGRVDEKEMQTFAARFGGSTAIGFFGQGEIASPTYEDTDEGAGVGTGTGTTAGAGTGAEATAGTGAPADGAGAAPNVAPAQVSGYCLAVLAVGLLD